MRTSHAQSVHRLATVGLFLSPFLLAPTIVGVVLLPVIAALVGPLVWPTITRLGAAGVGAVTLGSVIVGAAIVFPFAGLCGPDNDWAFFGGLVAGLAGYAVVAALAVRRPFVWALAPLAGATAFDAAMAVAMTAGVSWSC